QIRNVVPRFGRDACAGYLDAGAGSEAPAQLLETLLNPAQYAFTAQRSPILYAGGTASCNKGDPRHRAIGAVACGTNEALAAYRMGERVYDFNLDGLAHFGLVPDLLQDVANVTSPEGRPR